MMHLDEFLLLLFPLRMQLSVPLKNINRFFWFRSSSAKILNRLLNRMGCRKRFLNTSLKQNTKIMGPLFNRFCLSTSKTLKLGGLACQYDFELSVHLRNGTRKINHHKYDSLFPCFSILHLSKHFLVSLGTARFHACHCKSVQIFFIVSHTDTTQNKFAHTQIHMKYLCSFVHQILPKVLWKEQKEAPKLCFSPSPVSTYLSAKAFLTLKDSSLALKRIIFSACFT